MQQYGYKSIRHNLTTGETTMTQLEAYKLDGIKDLPMAIRVPFGKAWFAEYNGDHVLAAELLDKAVEVEKAQTTK